MLCAITNKKSSVRRGQKGKFQPTFNCTFPDGRRPTDKRPIKLSKSHAYESLRRSAPCSNQIKGGGVVTLTSTAMSFCDIVPCKSRNITRARFAGFKVGGRVRSLEMKRKQADGTCCIPLLQFPSESCFSPNMTTALSDTRSEGPWDVVFWSV